jgi:lysozyme family protein
MPFIGIEPGTFSTLGHTLQRPRGAALYTGFVSGFDGLLCAAIAPAHTLSPTPTRTHARTTVMNLRRNTTRVGAVASLFGLAALANAIPPMPYVVMATDPAAISCVQVAALACATVASWYMRRRRAQERAKVANGRTLPHGGHEGRRPAER